MSPTDKQLSNLQPQPFEPGNTAAVKHSVYSAAAIDPRATEIAAGLREFIPGYHPGFGVALTLAAQIAARLERAYAHVAVNGEWDEKGNTSPLHARISTWENSLAKQLGELGLTPAALSRMRGPGGGRGAGFDKFLAEVDAARAERERREQEGEAA